MITAQDNATIVNQMYRLFNERKLEEASRLVAADGTWTNVATGLTLRGPEGFVQTAQGWLRALPDARVEIRRQTIGESSVVTEFTGRGTHDGPLDTPNGSIPATGKPIEVEFCEILTLRDGKVVEARNYFDAATLLRQIGVTA